MSKKPAAKAKKPVVAQSTLVTFLLDRSSSMQSCKAMTIEAFNGYVGGLRGSKSKIDLSLITFDTEGMDKVYVETPVAQVPDLNEKTYQPRGGTPLIEAAVKTIHAVDASIKLKAVKPKVVVCIQTDGEENASGDEYTWDGLKRLIAEKQAEGWEFNFLGAGIDAYAQGAQMGISHTHTMSYDHTDERATKSAFGMRGQRTSLYASGAVADMSFSALEKQAAGDKFDPTLQPAGVTGGQPAASRVGAGHYVARPRPLPSNHKRSQSLGNFSL